MGSWDLHQGLVDAKIDHVWYIDTGDHGSPVGNSNLYLSSKMLFKPVGSVTSPPSIGNYTVGPGSFIALLRSAGPGFFENALVTKKIELPKNWDNLCVAETSRARTLKIWNENPAGTPDHRR
jgi:hypothetical protein